MCESVGFSAFRPVVRSGVLKLENIRQVMAQRRQLACSLRIRVRCLSSQSRQHFVGVVIGDKTLVGQAPLLFGVPAPYSMR